MVRCPKCGCTNISGPRYRPAEQLFSWTTVDEALVYTCGRCGYQQEEATLDRALARPSQEEGK